MSRGLNNNNPGNIRLSASQWLGQVVPGGDSSFCQFESMAYGYRAMFVLLNGYIAAGYDTIAKIIARYAPSSENNTTAYINHVVALTSIDQNTVIDPTNRETMINLVAAISFVENGTMANFTDVTAGYDLLNGEVTTVKAVGYSLAALVLVSALGYIAFKIFQKN